MQLNDISAAVDESDLEVDASHDTGEYDDDAGDEKVTEKHGRDLRDRAVETEGKAQSLSEVKCLNHSILRDRRSFGICRQTIKVQRKAS